MANKEILSSYSAKELKKMISETNIKKYSKLDKDGLIKLMLREEHVDKFKSIKMRGERVGKESKAKNKLLKEFKKRAKPAVKAFEFKEDQKKLTEAIEKKFPKKKGTHKMPDGTIMTGETHNENSKEVTPKKKIKRLRIKERSEKQKANDKRLGEQAKARAKKAK